jgi:hypothetical protein
MLLIFLSLYQETTIKEKCYVIQLAYQYISSRYVPYIIYCYTNLTLCKMQN